MKNYLILAGAVMILAAGCKKDDGDDSSPAAATPSSSISAVPSTFTQKVLIEEATGAWCGWCVDGAAKVEQLMTSNPEVVYGVAIHEGDGMQISVYNALAGVFSNSSFPAGMVNRVPYQGDVFMSRSYWSTVTNSQKALVAKCGLALETSTYATDSCKVIAHLGFLEAMTGNYRVTVYITQDDVSGTGSQWDQHNYLSGNSNYASSPYYSQPDPIVGYKHMNVVRKVLTADLGDVIPAASIVAGTDYKVTLKGKLPAGYNTAKMKVVAFISKYGSTATTHQVMNVQQVKLGSTKNWN